MNQCISYAKYLKIIKRKLPSIIYYEYNYDKSNLKTIKIMEDMMEKYPLVLCYRVKWLQKAVKNIEFTTQTHLDVVCFKNNRIKASVAIFSNSELHNLFKTVYNDCIFNCLSAYNRLMLKNRLISTSFIHKMYELPNYSYDITQKYLNKTDQLLKYSNKKKKGIPDGNFTNERKLKINNNNIYNRKYLTYIKTLPNSYLYNKSENNLIKLSSKKRHSSIKIIHENLCTNENNSNIRINYDNGISRFCFDKIPNTTSNLRYNKIYNYKSNNLSSLKSFNILENNKNYIKKNISECPYFKDPKSLFFDKEEKILDMKSYSIDEILLTNQTREFLNSANKDPYYFENLISDLNNDILCKNSLESINTQN